MIPNDLIGRIAGGYSGIEEAAVVQARTEALAKMSDDLAELLTCVHQRAQAGLAALESCDFAAARKELQALTVID